MWELIKSTYQQFPKPEKVFLFSSIFIVLLLSSISLLYGLFIANDVYFTGLNTINIRDKFTYLAQIEEARAGRFLTHNLYTAEPQSGYFSPFWLILGWFAKLTNWSAALVFHFFRLILGAVFLFTIYLIISRIFNNFLVRRITFIVLSLGSGLGALMFYFPGLNKSLPSLGTDLWITEHNIFSSISYSPSFILTQLLILFIFWWLIERLESAKLLEVFIIGLVALFLGIMHPYDLVIVYAVLALWLMVKAISVKRWLWPMFFKLLIIIGISCLAIGYFIILEYFDSAFALWTSQNVVLSPGIIYYLIGFGIILPFFLIGIYPTLKNKNKYLLLFLIWGATAGLLLYAPLPVQRRLGNGLLIPLVMVGTAGANFLIGRIKSWKLLSWRWLRLIVLIIVTILIFGTPSFSLGYNLFVFSKKTYPYFLPKEYPLAFEWLRENSLPASVILASDNTGVMIPAYALRTVYLGHLIQTAHYQQKRAITELWFFKNNINDQDKLSWLKNQQIDYIFWGEVERMLGDFDPFEKDYLELVYQNNLIAIFKVD